MAWPASQATELGRLSHYFSHYADANHCPVAHCPPRTFLFWGYAPKSAASAGTRYGSRIEQSGQSGQVPHRQSRIEPSEPGGLGGTPRKQKHTERICFPMTT